MNEEILIYGGTFDPPTVAHAYVISSCLEQFPNSHVWVVPSGQRADKSFSCTDRQRLTMVSLMIAEFFSYNRVRLLSDEIDRPCLTSTSDTVNEFRGRFPDKNFKYVFGSDAYDTMEVWKNGDQLKQQLPMVIVPRGKAHVEASENVDVLGVADVPVISSTEVRHLHHMGEDISHLVPASVAKYIAEQNLYGSRIVA